MGIAIEPTEIDEATIRSLGQPGDLGWVVMAHGEVYAREFGWDGSFEALVSRIVADYAAGHDPAREAAWIAEVHGRRQGCIFCVADPEHPGTALLRILLVHPDARGRNLGRRLVGACMDFARAAGYDRVRLWTNHPLVAARRLYLERGFQLVAEEAHHSFGVDLVGQTYELELGWKRQNLRVMPDGRPRRLIVNADDFGLTEGVNQGIIEAHTRGIVTSTSLMVNAPGARDAVRLAAEHPELSIGLHFVDDTPRLDEPDHAAREFAAQLERFRELMGAEPTHVDSHHHVHMQRLATFSALVEPLGVPLRGDGRVQYLGAFFAHPEVGVVEPDRIREPFLLHLIETEARDEFVELGCHPGRVTAQLRSSYGPEREAEIETLTAPGLGAKITELGRSLASYRDWRAS